MGKSILIDYKTNNLNFIRLFAAFQVLIDHLISHLFSAPESVKYVHMFNGVPIFFTISGYLIFWSYDNNPKLKNYFFNRFLRIYPALFCSFIITVFLLLIFQTIDLNDVKSSSFIFWILSQLTFIQQFTPSVVHGFGGFGNPNPPLWTISVEILLYCSIPFLYGLINKYSKKAKTLIIIVLAAISYIENSTDIMHSYLESLSSNGYYKIFLIPFFQFISFFFFFAFGILFYLHKEKLTRRVINKVHILLPVYILFSVILVQINYYPGNYHPNILELFNHLLLVFCIFSVAYTKSGLTSRVLGKTDISYGLYIYHFLVINVFRELGLFSEWWFIPCMALCFFVGHLSWILVEKPVLKLKKISLHKI